MSKTVVVSYIDEFDEMVTTAFSGSNCHFLKEKELQGNEVIDFAIIDSIQKMNELRIKFESENSNTKFIMVGRNNKIKEFCYLQGTMIIDPFWLKSEFGTVLLKRSMEELPSIQLSEIFSKNFDHFFSYKIPNILRLGYYADLLCKDALDQKMNFVSIRTFFDHAVLYFAYLQKLGIIEFPCELEYANQNGYFAMMIHVGSTHLSSDYLIESLGEDNIKHPMSSLLKTCLRNCDYFDIMYHPKGKRLSLIGLWTDEENRKAILSPSLSLCVVKKKGKNKNPESSYRYNYDHQLDPEVLKNLDEKSNPSLPGSYQELTSLFQSSNLNKDQELLQELTFYIKEKVALDNIERSQTGEDFSAHELTPEDIIKALNDFPDQSKIKNLNTQDQELLSVLVASGNLSDSVVEFFNSTMEGNTAQKVKGTKQIEEDDVVIVSGDAEFKGNEYKTRKAGITTKNDGSGFVTIVSGSASFEGSEYKVRKSNHAGDNKDAGYKVTSNDALMNKIKELEEKQIFAKNGPLQKEQMEMTLSNLQKEHEKEIKKITREKEIIKNLLESAKKNIAQDMDTMINKGYTFSPKEIEAQAQIKKNEIILANKEEEIQNLQKLAQSKDRALQSFSEERSKMEEEISSLKMQIHQKSPLIQNAPPPLDLTPYEEKISILQGELMKEKQLSEDVKNIYMLEKNKLKSLEAKYKELNDKYEQQSLLLNKTAPPQPNDKKNPASTSLVGTWTDIPKDLNALNKINKVLEENNKNMVKELEAMRTKVTASKVDMEAMQKKHNALLQEKDKAYAALQTELKLIKHGLKSPNA